MNTKEEELGGIVTAAVSLAAGIALGATAMYLLDPDRGRSRRARLEDMALRRVRKAEREAAGLGEDLVNRARGVIAKAGAVANCFTPVDDETLADRVRSRLGHITRHAHTIDSSVSHGVVRLKGTLESEEERLKLMQEVARVPGVKALEACWNQPAVA